MCDVCRRLRDRRHPDPRARSRHVGRRTGGRELAHYFANRNLRGGGGYFRKRHASVEEAEEDVNEFLRVAGISAVPITERDAETALSAFSRYGKGRGHPARLNLGDCFAYAVARNHRTALLFKGEDFEKTDIPSAVHR